MQRNLNARHKGVRFLWLSMLIGSALVFAGCGPLGDDEEDPTATSETIAQPTVTSESTTGAETTIETASEDDSAATPTTDSTSPEAFAPGNGAATPEGSGEPFEVVVGTPSIPGESVTPDGSSVATPDSGEPEQPGAGTTFTGSDGTDGATPPAGDLTDPDDDESLAEATPDQAGAATPAEETPFFTEEVATPVATPAVAGATPQAGELEELEPVTVTSCEPENVPPFIGEQVEFLTVTDVNFRVGPGSDCDLVSEGPIGVNIPATLISGPVVREGEEDFVWVQVQIADDIGWLIVSAIEPVP